MKLKCQHCNIPWESHGGISVTCKALQQARGALKVICTWAEFNDGTELVPEHVAKLCRKTLYDSQYE